MKRNFNIFFDLDDTLADLGSNKTKEELMECLHTEGYFANLKPLGLLKHVNELASMCPENIYILSACVDTDFCAKEKVQWLKKYLPAVSKHNALLTKVGCSKAETAMKVLDKKAGLDDHDILVDDYSVNISDWEAHGGVSIKFKNSYNNTNPDHQYKYIIEDFSQLMDVIEKIRTDSEIKRKDGLIL